MGGYRKTDEEKEAELLEVMRSTGEELKALRARKREKRNKLDTRRKVLAGVYAQMESRRDAEARALMVRSILAHIEERDKYVFPELFPDAKPPQRPKKEPTDSGPERAEMN